MLQIVCLAIRALGTDMIGKRETDSSGSHKARTRGMPVSILSQSAIARKDSTSDEHLSPHSR